MAVSFKKTINKDLLTAYIFRGSGVLMTFAINVVLARIYGIELSGEYYVIHNFTALACSIAFLGYSYVIVRYATPCYTDKKNVYLGNLLLSISMYTIALISIVIVIGMIVFEQRLSMYLYGDLSHIKNIQLSFIAMLTYIPILTIVEVFKALKKPNESILVANIMTNLVFIILLLVGQGQKNIESILWLYIASNIISLGFLFFSYRKMFASYSVKLLSPNQTVEGYKENREICKSYQKENLILALVAISNVVLNVFDTMAISSRLSVADVAIYSIANKVVSFGSIIITTVNSLIGYKIAELSYNRDQQGLSKILVKYTRIMIPLGFAYYAFAVVFSLLIPLIFGKEYESSVFICFFLAVGQLIAIVTGPCSYFVIMTGNAKKYSQIVVLSAGISIVSNLVLVGILGIYGSAVSSILTLGYKNIRTFILAKDKADISLKEFIQLERN